MSSQAPTGELDDAELVRRSREGEAEAFRVLFERHAPAVRRFLGGVLRDEHAAEDGLQETFLRAFRGFGRLEDPRKLRGWLLGIGRIVALDDLAARRREPLAEPDDAAAEEHEPLDTPEENLLGEEAGRVLREEMERLSAPRRAALLLRLDHGLGYPEIAEAMGWPLHKVKNEIHRARLAIRGRLLDYLGGKA